MFSGIVEEKGRVKNITRTDRGCRLTVASAAASEGSRIGDSISVNGVCLTVVSVSGKDVTFDVMEETLRGTSLSGVSSGKEVNLEKSLKAGERISGHYVTGHVDCMGRIRALERRPNDYAIDVEIPKDKIVYTAEKGSIAIDGVSLTVAGIRDDRIRLYIIPLTLRETNLGSKRINDAVNVEFDILGKYALKNAPAAKKKIDTSFLKEHGFA